MQIPQTTIGAPVHAIGVGVHTAVNSRLTLRPAAADAGIRFVRTDVEMHPVRVCPSAINDTFLASTIGNTQGSVQTIEHLLAALWGTGIDNALVEIHGPEVPILDGSSAPFVELIRSAGCRAQRKSRRFIRIERTVRVEDGDAYAELKPHDGFRSSYTYVHDHPVINRFPTKLELDFCEADFERDVSMARTFGLLDDLPKAQAIGKCMASSEANAVGIDDDGIINAEGLRCDDEFVKHKLLDAMGDLYQLGYQVVGEFVGHMSGHTLNNRLVRALIDDPTAWSFETRQEEALPGRAAFLS